MHETQFHLLRSRRFLPLFVTQFLGAFNDNVFKNALVVLITYRSAAAAGLDGQIVITLAAGLFILPFFLFSATAGQLADKLEKSRLIRLIKLCEVLLMVLAGLGYALDSLTILMAVLFLMGAQSTFFGPLKYGILPDHLRPDELIGGNALIEAGTFLAILFGTILGTQLALIDGGLMFVSILAIGFALAGWAGSWLIPSSGPAAPDLRINPNILKGTLAIMRHAAGERDVFLSILGISWFWLVGATFLSQFPTYAKDVLGANQNVLTLFLTIFSLGIGAGSLLCNRALKGEINAKYVPLGGLGMALFSADLVWASARAVGAADGALLGLGGFLAAPANLRVVADLLLIAICGGVYIVPLYAILQSRTEERHRARTIAGNNIVNALFMVAAALATTAMLALGFTVTQVFLVVAVGNAVVAAYICKLLPDEVVKAFARWLFRRAYRVEVRGLESYKQAGERVVIVVNHTSFLDGALLCAFLPETPTVAINSFIARRWWMRPAFMLFDLLPLDPTNPMAAKTMVRAVKQGRKLLIFPEGRITVTGALMKIYEGPGAIADLADAAILPVRIDGAQYTPFSRLKGKMRLRWFPKITVTILPAAALRGAGRDQGPGEAPGARQPALRLDGQHDLRDRRAVAHPVPGAGRRPGGPRRARAGDRGHRAQADELYGPDPRQPDPGPALGRNRRAGRDGWAVAAQFGGGGRGLHGLAGLRPGASPAELLDRAGQHAVGLPHRAHRPGRDLAALHRAGQAGGGGRGAVRRGRAGLSGGPARPARAARQGLRGLGGRGADWTHRRIAKAPGAGDPAVVLFTSGSEGTPKGVVLSHGNLLANRSQLSARIEFNPTDRVFNALPVFHSFGLTGGLLLPLFSGILTFLYPSPLHYRIVPELAYDRNATILFGTDTFLAGYARAAHPYDFYSLRYVFAGAERLKDETRRVWAEKFGLRIFEGYGATETAPALSINTPMHFKAGTVGRLLPGIDHRLVPVPGVAEGGRLEVAGPNVMLGYLRAERPGELEPPADGWYDTGDIVTLDEAGYVTIKGRAKRFAKIAGEMVSLAAVEEQAAALWPEHGHAVVAVADARKGEQLVLITENAAAERGALQAHVQANGGSELTIPRAILTVEHLPLLGTGKTDYVAVQALAAPAAT